MQSNFIQVTGLKKHFQMGYTTVRALDNITLTIPSQSFTIVMGPSGSGKSTLLYLLGGLDRPSDGLIEIDGLRLDQMDENQLAVFRRQTVGFVFQSFNLVQSMTAMENVAFPMIFNRSTPRERSIRARELLERVGLGDRRFHKPNQLSGGEQQRVAVARSLTNDPRLILADEPTGNLDTTSGVGVMQLLSELHHQGRTVLVVTHDPRMVKFSTHQIYLLDGNVVDKSEYESEIIH